jgi:hypothetical protein
MASKVAITFEKIDSDAAHYMLCDVTEGKPYAATVYGPEEVDDLGNPGCGLDYYVFIDDTGRRVGYAKAPWDTTVFKLTA